MTPPTRALTVAATFTAAATLTAAGAHATGSPSGPTLAVGLLIAGFIAGAAVAMGRHS